MIDTHIETIQRIRAAKAVQRAARLNRRINAAIECTISVVSLTLLGAFVLGLLNWHTHEDFFATLVQRGAEVLVLPFQPFFAYAVLSFNGGLFAPIYLIAAAVYILAGMTLSWIVRRVLQ